MVGWRASPTRGADDVGAQYLASCRREDVIDLLAGRLRDIEAAERADALLVRVLDAKGVHECPAGRHSGDRGILFSRIEIAGDDHRLVRKRPLLDALAQQLRTALARGLRLVIEMHVEVPEAAAVAIDEARPRADTRDAVAPRLRGDDARSVREPERARVRNVKAVAAEENRRVLPLPRAVVTADANHAVGGNRGDDFIDLKVQRFLKAHEIRVLLLDDVDQEVLAQRPAVLPIVGRPEADVVGQHRERSTLRWACLCERGEYADDKNERRGQGHGRV